MNLSHALSANAPVTVLRLEGRLDWAAASQVEQFANQRRQGRVDDVGLMLDLGALDFCDSLALGMLVSLAQDEKRAGRELVVFGLQPPVRRMLEVVRLHDWFLLFDDSEAALRWLAPVAAGA